MANLKRYFSLYYFSSVVEGALYNTYMALFLSTVKGISAADITILMSAGFLVSVTISPLFGILVDKIRSYNILFYFSIISYLITIAAWLQVDSMPLLYASFIVYTISKMPIQTLGDMFAAESQKRGLIDFGKVRSFAAVGYAITPMILGFVFSTLFQGIISYELIMALMSGIVIMNAIINLKIASLIKFEKKPKNEKKGFHITRNQAVSLFFLMCSSLIFNGTNNVSVNFQSLYIQEILYSTSFIGIVVFAGSVLEWPLMRLSTRIHNRLGLFNSLFLLCGFVIVRWLLYYFAGRFHSLLLLLAGSSINGIGQALFLPLSIRYIRQIASSDNFGFLFTLNGSLNAIVNWLFYQGVSQLTLFLDLAHIYLVFAGFAVVWLCLLLIWRMFTPYFTSELQE